MYIYDLDAYYSRIKFLLIALVVNRDETWKSRNSLSCNVSKNIGKSRSIPKACKADCEVVPSRSLQTYSRVSNESVPASRIKVRFQIFK